MVHATYLQVVPKLWALDVYINKPYVIKHEPNYWLWEMDICVHYIILPFSVCLKFFTRLHQRIKIPFNILPTAARPLSKNGFCSTVCSQSLDHFFLPFEIMWDNFQSSVCLDLSYPRSNFYMPYITLNTEKKKWDWGRGVPVVSGNLHWRNNLTSHT